jgi:hypothetical protein
MESFIVDKNAIVTHILLKNFDFKASCQEQQRIQGSK